MMDFDRRKGIRLIILDILSRENLHGYGIAEKIEETYGVKKPSSGVIYPTLSHLLRSELIEVVSEGKREKKIYGITDKGRRYLEEHRDEVQRAKSILANLGEFHRLGGHEMMEEIGEIIKNLHKLGPRDKERLEKVLRRTARELRKIAGGIHGE